MEVPSREAILYTGMTHRPEPNPGLIISVSYLMMKTLAGCCSYLAPTDGSDGGIGWLLRPAPNGWIRWIEFLGSSSLVCLFATCLNQPVFRSWTPPMGRLPGLFPASCGGGGVPFSFCFSSFQFCFCGL